jgi:hypothetical protein
MMMMMMMEGVRTFRTTISRLISKASIPSTNDAYSLHPEEIGDSHQSTNIKKRFDKQVHESTPPLNEPLITIESTVSISGFSESQLSSPSINHHRNHRYPI